MVPAEELRRLVLIMRPAAKTNRPCSRLSTDRMGNHMMELQHGGLLAAAIGTNESAAPLIAPPHPALHMRGI
jgi:hypothetical protein